MGRFKSIDRFQIQRVARVNPVQPDGAVAATDTQVKKMREYAEQCYEVVSIFIDKGIGSSVGKCLAYQKMLTLASEESKPFDVVLVWQDKKLSRDAYNYVSVRLSELDVNAVPVNESGDCINADKKDLMEFMSMCFSMHLFRDICKGIKIAKERKLAEIANMLKVSEVVR